MTLKESLKNLDLASTPKKIVIEGQSEYGEDKKKKGKIEKWVTIRGRKVPIIGGKPAFVPKGALAPGEKVIKHAVEYKTFGRVPKKKAVEGVAKKPKKFPEYVKTYIRDATDEGKTATDIVNVLTKKGYDENTVMSELLRIRKTPKIAKPDLKRNKRRQEQQREMAKIYHEYGIRKRAIMKIKNLEERRKRLNGLEKQLKRITEEAKKRHKRQL